MGVPRQLDISPIDVVYVESREELEMSTHFHNSYEIIYVLEGNAQFHISGKTYEVHENSILFISNLESHEMKVTQYPYRRYFILIKPEYFRSVVNEPVLVSLIKNRPEHFSHVIRLSPDIKPKIMGILQDMHKEAGNREDFWEMALKSGLHQLFILLYRNRREAFPITSVNKSAGIILEVQKYIDEHCIESISLNDISSMFYTDMYYLSHLFKRVTGFTFKEYLILQRISRAKDRLFYTNEDVTQVAINSGFNNVNHFIRIFKKFEGITPYQYRMKFR